MSLFQLNENKRVAAVTETITAKGPGRRAMRCVGKPGCYAVNTIETNDANCELTSGFVDVTDLIDAPGSRLFILGMYIIWKGKCPLQDLLFGGDTDCKKLINVFRLQQMQ